MDGIARTPRPIKAFRRIWLVLALMGAGVLLEGRVNAGAIVHHAKFDRAAVSSWSEYLMGGPSVWSSVSHPLLTDNVKREIHKALKTDPGATAPMVQFLLWKQSLDPKRFDHYHRTLVGPLARIAATIPTVGIPTITAAQVLAPQTTAPAGTTTLPTEAQTTLGGSEQTVPEPGSVLLTLGLTGWAVYWRRRHD